MRRRAQGLLQALLVSNCQHRLILAPISARFRHLRSGPDVTKMGSRSMLSNAERR